MSTIKRMLQRWLVAAALACVVPGGIMPSAAQRLPDEPAAAPAERVRPPSTPLDYADALGKWSTPDDIAAFVGATFVYDRSRALALAEVPGQTARPAIYPPEQVFARPSGVCVDLARFAVETLNRIDRRYAARYLMIEFEPVTVQGRTLRRHWVALFERDGALFAFADSWRPGVVAGPYRSVEDYVGDYARVRERPIVSWQERSTFERRLRASRAAGGISR